MLRTTLLMLAAAGLLACGPSYAKLKVDKIESVSVAVDGTDQRFCAYRPVALRALVTYVNGKQALSRVPGERSKGRLRTSEFGWEASHGTVSAQAVFALPHTPLTWFDEPIRVTARVLARPELVGEGTLHPRFDCGGTLDVRGALGARGGEAEHGGPGATGPQVHVALTYLDSRHRGRLVLVRVQSGSEPVEHFIIDPRDADAPFVLDARGGDGGRGGQGVDGFGGRPGLDGRDGADGRRCGEAVPGEDGTDGEPGGPGGPGANGGRGGDGGTVYVHYDARFPELSTRIQVRVDGGQAGPAGAGGAGGRGGDAGRGGRGGAGEPPRPAAEGEAASEPCRAPDGRSGVAGVSGPAGPSGAAGTAGAPGQRYDQADDVRELFAEELQRGLPIPADANGGGQ